MLHVPGNGWWHAMESETRTGFQRATLFEERSVPNRYTSIDNTNKNSTMPTCVSPSQHSPQPLFLKRTTQPAERYAFCRGPRKNVSTHAMVL